MIESGWGRIINVSGDRDANPEHGTARGLGLNLDPVSQQFNQPGDDGQAKAKPALGLVVFVAALIEFLEDQVFLTLGNATAGIPDLNTQGPAPAPAPEQNPAFVRIFECIGQQVPKDPVEQAGVGPHM